MAREAWPQRGGVPATPQELNRYAYARNNPLRYTDPTGHCIGWIWGAPDCRFAGWDPAHWSYGDALDAVPTGFDVAGLLPGVGEPFDGANALISLARGDPAGAALAAAALIPGAGMGATSAKLAARYGDEAAEAVVKPFDLVSYGTKASGLEMHHGVLDVWASANISGYISRRADAPAIALTKAQHDATRSVFVRWRIEQTGSATGAMDWTAISARAIHDLSERMFDAAGVPLDARHAYYQAFHRYIYGER